MNNYVKGFLIALIFFINSMLPYNDISTTILFLGVIAYFAVKKTKYKEKIIKEVGSLIISYIALQFVFVIILTFSV